MKTHIHSFITLAAVACSLMFAGNTHAAVSQQTIKNLNAAFQGESNASNRYAKFAAKAEAEGFSQVARLYRATSASEAIHRDTHKAAILELGGTVANFELETVTPGTTAENLAASVKGETYERDTMYPEFIAKAKADDARPAMRTFGFAIAAEKEHTKLYQDALVNLGKNDPTGYYVCNVCGMTLKLLPDKKCPSCRKGREEFKLIN